MIQKNKNLQTAASAGEYLAPEVKVKKARARKMLCQSIVSSSSISVQDDGELGDGGTL